MSEILSLKDELNMINDRYNDYWSSVNHSSAEMLAYINKQLEAINNVTKIITETTLIGNYKNNTYDNEDTVEKPLNNISISSINTNHESVSEMNLSVGALTVLNKEMDAWGIPETYMCREVICELINMVENGEIEPTDCLTYDEFKIVISKLADVMNVPYNSITSSLNAMIRKADFSKSITFKDFNNIMTDKHTVLSRFIAFIADNAYD